MTGFIRGLFGNKKKQAPPPSDQGAFYLDADQAKSLGDIDYMRSTKTIKHTFAKKKGQTEELESIKSVSAMEASRLREDGTPLQAATFEAAESAIQPEIEQVKKQRSQTDNGLDMFRTMARDIKK
jgi:hypothetical protein